LDNSKRQIARLVWQHGRYAHTHCCATQRCANNYYHKFTQWRNICSLFANPSGNRRCANYLARGERKFAKRINTFHSGGNFGNTCQHRNYNFTVKATNSAGSDSKALTIIVKNAGFPVITTTSLPNGNICVAYSATLTVTSETAVTWSLESGNLPTGLTLSVAGVISGTPTVAGTFTFTVKATNSIGSDTKALSILIDNVGVVENALANIRIYPNPTTGELIIDNGELTINNVEIFDIYGKKIVSHTANHLPQTVLNISHLPSGIYFLQITTEKGLVNKKVVKQ
jgi:hypothetical protein